MDSVRDSIIPIRFGDEFKPIKLRLIQVGSELPLRLDITAWWLALRRENSYSDGANGK